MSRAVLSLIVVTVTASLSFSSAACASGAELEEAITLLKQMHADQCQQQKLRGNVMLAHRNHDEETLNELWPKIEAIGKRLKPVEDKLNLLKASIKKNPDDQSAFETALLQQSDCG